MNNANTANLMQWLESGGKLAPEAMRPQLGMHQNALLRKYEWEEIDAAVLDVARLNLPVSATLQGAGLTHNLGGLGTIISVYEQVSDMSDAELSMEGIKRGELGGLDFTPQSVPVPIVHKDFWITLRHLLASRNKGEALDTTMARVATRKVAEKVESMILNGSDKQLAGFKIYGLTTKPERIQKTAAQCGGGDFATEGNPYKTFLGAMGFLGAAAFGGPYGVFIARTQYLEVLHRLTDGSSLSELAAIQQGIPNISFITVADGLAAGSFTMFQLSSDVVDLAIAQDITPVQWDEMGGMMTNYRIMTALVPRIKHDANGASGLIHVTGC